MFRRFIFFMSFVVTFFMFVMPSLAKLKHPDLALTSEYRITNCSGGNGESKCFEVKVKSLAAPILLNHPLEYVVEYDTGFRLGRKFSTSEWNNIKSKGWTWAKIGVPLAPGKYNVKVRLYTSELYPSDKNYNNDTRNYSFIIPVPKYDIEFLSPKKAIHGNTCKVALVLWKNKGIMSNSASVANAYRKAMDKGWVIVKVKSSKKGQISKKYLLKDIFKSNYKFRKKVYEIPDYSFDMGPLGIKKDSVLVEATLYVPSEFVDGGKYVLKKNRVLLMEDKKGNTIKKVVKCQKLEVKKPKSIRLNGNIQNNNHFQTKPNLNPNTLHNNNPKNMGGFHSPIAK